MYDDIKAVRDACAGKVLKVILWGIMIIATLILAFIDNEACHKVFTGLLFTDIVFPVVIYAMTLVYKILSGRKNKK